MKTVITAAVLGLFSTAALALPTKIARSFTAFHDIKELHADVKEDSTAAVYYTVANTRDTSYYINKRTAGWQRFDSYIAANSSLNESNPDRALELSSRAAQPMSPLFDVTAIGTIDGHAKSASGLSLDGTSLHAQTADVSYPGMMSTTTQSFAGAKTFTELLSVKKTLDAALVVDANDGKTAALVAGALKSSFLFDNSGTFSIQPQTKANIRNGTPSGLPVLEIMPAGNVGIGVSNPVQRLHVSGHIQADGTVNAALIVNNTGGKAAAVVAGANRSSFLFDNSGSFSIQPQNKTGVTSGTPSGLPVLEILANGNMGVGNTTPGELLTLGTAGTRAGNISLAGATSGKAVIAVLPAAGSPVLTLPTTTGTLTTAEETATLTNKIIGSGSTYNAGEVTSSGAVTGATIVKTGGTSSQFLKADGSVDTNSYLLSTGTSGYMARFNSGSAVENSGIFESSGNIGIGTTNPQGYKLAVNGNVIAESVKVKLQGEWPDYVFRENYKLSSLPDLEKYIQVNRHLPGVPSEEEVKENGIDLGKMNAILLQKIEELTLHLVSQGKEISRLKQQMENVKAQEK